MYVHVSLKKIRVSKGISRLFLPFVNHTFGLKTSVQALEPVRKIIVFVRDMTEEILEFCKFDHPKTLLCRGYSPVEMLLKGFHPTACDYLILAQFCKKVLNFVGE